jgi:hypothetical protein
MGLGDKILVVDETTSEIDHTVRGAARGGGGDSVKEKAVCRTTPLALMMVVAGDIFGKACHHVAPSSEK